ncbi:MAG: hypothetical protein LBP34_07070 [Flavobacteriaceae bacterium]|nr:hypothetical protein [Flavobacteriaceae bacterium]
MIKKTCVVQGYYSFSPAFQAGRVVVCALRRSPTLRLRKYCLSGRECALLFHDAFALQ